MKDTSDSPWIDHPMHPTRARFDGKTLVVEQEVTKRLRLGPLFSVVVSAWLRQHTSWDADEDAPFYWSMAFGAMGDWPVEELGYLQLVRGGDGRPGLRRGRKISRIQQNLREAWRGTKRADPWLDLGTSGIIPLVLHYRSAQEVAPLLWAEVQEMAYASLMATEGRTAYRLAHILDLLPAMGDACVYCGSRKELTFDHAIPLFKGGAPWGENLVTACRACNSRKGSSELETWLQGLPGLHDPEKIRLAQEARTKARQLPQKCRSRVADPCGGSGAKPPKSM